MPPASPSSPSSSPSLPLPFILLPHQLQRQLDDAYLLHQLSLRPATILPPGKSVLSLYTQTRKRAREAGDGTQEALGVEGGNLPSTAEIERHALEKLSSPSASVQLSRLQQLYIDLAEALAPLLPPEDPLLIQLREPMSPTSSPVESALFHLSPLLHHLLKICAPVRDGEVQALLERITPPPPARSPDLPQIALDTFRGILDLSREMRSDLRDAHISLLGEKQLRLLIRREAGEEERAVVRRFYEGVQLDDAWEEWVGTDGEGERRWVAKIIHCLGSNRPVQPSIPTRFDSPRPDGPTSGAKDTGEGEESRNYLPPQLLLESPALLLAQNTIQALTITACLATLVQPTPRVASPSSALGTEDQLRFTARIWTLLSGEIDASIPSCSQQEGTKLVHLEEEVVSAWCGQRKKRKAQHTPKASLDAVPAEPVIKPVDTQAAQEEDPDIEAERQLRKSVSRLLRTEDPVFALLRRRLVDALAAHFSRPPVPEGERAKEGQSTPRRLRAGRGLPGALKVTELEEEEVKSRWDGRVKGFEDEVLRREVEKLARELGDVVGWVEEVWGVGR
ncbi:hypothetical protein DACRYDRAFT_14265 [Dacryopinax primogenitus]|uniref:Uncharacterized protein n=1 Tax=Dacryopinax primogenitus (strain DJM 731) TaxID=1858805 RepID=M5G787_DACPD|nr:uncharacterized protein DACRYDRAFT_14265 [Dacryopinax primogenitus]EJU04065.1 hypothetical protein DACRYDRAFT_14265 [Dacryopinax primogenitus]